MPIIRLPLSQPIESRTASFAKDSRSVNGYFETRDQTKREFIKRPGLLKPTVTPALDAEEAQGLAAFNGSLYAVTNNKLYKINPTTYASSVVGSISGSVDNCYFTNTLNNQYMFFHNTTNGYLVNGSTGALTQITSDVVATVNIVTGGTQYSEGSVPTFSAAPSGGTTATGSLTLTGGIVTNVVISNPGSGYLTAPTVSITKPADVTGVSVTNTSGTNILTAASITGTVYTGMTVTGTDIPAGTTVTAISGTGPYTITISNTTTGAVTTADFKDEGNGFVATTSLNYFPSNLVPGAVFLDSYVFVGTENGRIYSSNVGNPTIWNPLDYLTAESEPDNLVAITKHFNYIIGFGQWSTEFFYDIGNAVGSPLAPAPAYRMEIGCANGNSVVQFEQSVIWIGKSKSEGAQVFMLEGTSPIKVSTTYIDRWLKASALNDVKSYVFKMNGHTFYVMTLHDLNVTLVYDVNEKMWYQWTMYAPGDVSEGQPAAYAEQYFRPSYFVALNSKYWALDDDTGELYIISSDYYTDAGAPIYYRSVTDIMDSGTTKRKFYNRVEIVGDKIPATMMIRHTDTDYQTWSSYRQVDLSKVRPQIYQCGGSRRRAWEFLCTDAVPLRLDAAEIDFNIGEMEQEAVAPPSYRR